MKPIRDWSACQQIKCFGEDYSGFLRQPPEYVFTHGACHAFALELRDLLKQNNTTEPKLYLITNGPLPVCEGVVVDAPIVRHVFVLTSSDGIDINGIQHASRFLEDWRKAPDDISEELVFEDWLTKPSPSGGMQSVVGLRADSSFLSEARKLAAKIIQGNPGKFGVM